MLRHLAQAEAEELTRRLDVTAQRADADREELSQLQQLYEEERAQATMMEEALRSEREAMHKLTATLELERGRAKAASDRDADTIIELRTALEVDGLLNVRIKRRKESIRISRFRWKGRSLPRLCRTPPGGPPWRSSRGNSRYSSSRRRHTVAAAAP